MDYYKIGKRIRRFRKACGLSQEQLAEKVGISPTHMSHIETANTKLSLTVLLNIAKALDVQTDDLLLYAPRGQSTVLKELAEVLDGCTATQSRIIADISKAVKTSLDKHIDE